MPAGRWRTYETRARHRHDRRRIGGRLLLLRRPGGVASLPGYADAPAGDTHSRQSRPRLRGDRVAAAARLPVGRSQARLHLAARAAGRRDDLPAHRAGRARRRAAAMTVALALEIGLAVLVASVAVWTI